MHTIHIHKDVCKDAYKIKFIKKENGDKRGQLEAKTGKQFGTRSIVWKNKSRK